jgi:hypothetical protein
MAKKALNFVTRFKRYSKPPQALKTLGLQPILKQLKPARGKKSGVAKQ